MPVKNYYQIVARLQCSSPNTIFLIKRKLTSIKWHTVIQLANEGHVKGQIRSAKRRRRQIIAEYLGLKREVKTCSVGVECIIK